MPMMTVRDLLTTARETLKQSPSALMDAEILLMHVLGCTRSFLYAHSTDAVSEQHTAHYNQLLAQREQGTPIAYLVNRREFWSLPLYVTPATLIPRPETELLVEITLATFAEQNNITLIDLGCGSGAIALALAKTHHDWSIIATDLSEAALAVAKINSDKLNIKNIRFMQSDWFETIPHQLVEGIVSNPPYIAADDVHLQSGDLRFEPLEALVSGQDGLDAIRQIILHATNYLKPGGALILEHGYNQANAVANLLQTHGFESIQCTCDLQGHPRVTQAVFSSSQSPVTMKQSGFN